MKGSSRDLEKKPYHRHDQSSAEQWLPGRSQQSVADFAQESRLSDSIDQADAEQGKGAGCTAEKEIFESCLSRINVCLVDRGDDVKGKPE